jgi:hypothetical protein
VGVEVKHEGGEVRTTTALSETATTLMESRTYSRPNDPSGIDRRFSTSSVSEVMTGRSSRMRVPTGSAFILQSKYKRVRT